MKLLNYNESAEWLLLSRLSISTNRSLVNTSQAEKTQLVFAAMPTDVRGMSYAAAAITNWVPLNRERLLWLQNWETLPAFQWRFFESIRPDCVPLIEAPGHLFSADRIWLEAELGLDNTSVSRDTALISGMLSLVASFGWDGFLVARDSSDYIEITDRHVYFCSAEQERIERALAILRSFSLVPKFAQL